MPQLLCAFLFRKRNILHTPTSMHHPAATRPWKCPRLPPRATGRGCAWPLRCRSDICHHAADIFLCRSTLRRRPRPHGWCLPLILSAAVAPLPCRAGRRELTPQLGLCPRGALPCWQGDGCTTPGLRPSGLFFFHFHLCLCHFLLISLGRRWCSDPARRFGLASAWLQQGWAGEGGEPRSQ